MRLHRSLAAALSAIALAACGSDAVQKIAGPAPSAAVRFFNYSVGSPSVHFYAGDQKMTATTSASCQAAQDPPVTANDSVCVTVGKQSTSGIAYGGAGAGGRYSGIEPSQYTVTGRPVTASGPGTPVSTLTVTIGEGKRYSVYQSGIYDTTAKIADAFVVEDDIPATIDWSTALVRFVNAAGNAEPMALVAVDAADTTRKVPVGGTIAYQSAGAFVALPPGSYEMRARVQGDTTDAIVLTGVLIEAGRAYTVAAFGDMTETSATADERPKLDYTVHP